VVLRLRDKPPGSWDDAKCLDITVNKDYDPFFSEDEVDIEEAVNFCNGEADGRVCPIREQCLLFALTNNEKFGIWGGSTEITRKAIRKKYPSRGGKRNENWHWMTEQEALEGLDRKALKEELQQEKEE
jgi:hypothetical protein